MVLTWKKSPKQVVDLEINQKQYFLFFGEQTKKSKTNLFIKIKSYKSLPAQIAESELFFSFCFNHLAVISLI